MILTHKRLPVDIFLTHRLSKSLAFCEFASINFERWRHDTRTFCIAWNTVWNNYSNVLSGVENVCWIGSHTKYQARKCLVHLGKCTKFGSTFILSASYYSRKTLSAQIWVGNWRLITWKCQISHGFLQPHPETNDSCITKKNTIKKGDCHSHFTKRQQRENFSFKWSFVRRDWSKVQDQYLFNF